jgi:hypothetical protein
VTSRDRIAQLENSVSQLWTVVGALKTELGHSQDDLPHHEHASVEGHEEQSEMSEMSPMNPPAHLQQLFDNEFVDTQANDAISSDVGSDRISKALLDRARTKMHALMPSKEDIRRICAPSMNWITIYANLFPSLNKFNSGE